MQEHIFHRVCQKLIRINLRCLLEDFPSFLRSLVCVISICFPPNLIYPDCVRIFHSRCCASPLRSAESSRIPPYGFFGNCGGSTQHRQFPIKLLRTSMSTKRPNSSTMVTRSQEVISGRDNSWLCSEADGADQFDLTHPATPDSASIYPRIPLKTTTAQVSIDPAKTALVIVDLQNYFLSPSLGRPTNAIGSKVVGKFLQHAIPACRKARNSHRVGELGLNRARHR